MLPLLLFTLGAGGPWIGTLVRLAPYQPYFIAVAVACLGYGYWLHRSSNQQYAAACSTRLASKFVNPALVVATILVIAAIAFDFLAPLLNS
jgi:mercuric ion transport protein